MKINSALKLAVLVLLTFITSQIIAQNPTLSDSVSAKSSTSGKPRILFGGTITNFGYGGPALKFSKYNNQFAILPGGRGACTINNRITLGGGGYGMANSIILPDSGYDTDTAHYYKMGYGGLEIGYIIISGRKMNIGSTLLFAAGAEFIENKSASNNKISYGKDFKIIPVFEPSLYVEFQLNQIIRLHTGISYRFVKSNELNKIHVPDMSGFSCYIGLLFGNN
ncbi:MAG: hypothetical protein HZB98_07850 [Bacteroidia bacterium]|nr:hypothetical protein [Bacteroidia bacterium]